MLTQATEFLRLCHIDRMGDISYAVLRVPLTMFVFEPVLARHSKSKLFLCSRLLAAFSFQFSVFTFYFALNARA